MSTNAQETLALLKVAQANPDELIKAFVAPTAGQPTQGFQAYNLEAPAKNLFPVLTPLRNTIARVSGGFASQANWKAFTNINVGKQRAGVSDGKRGGIIGATLAEYFAAFRGFGLENSVTFEAQYAATNFDDAKAKAVSQLLGATMIQEERLILGGNTTLNLGTTPTPTVVGSNSGGALTAATWSVICVALGLQSYLDTVGVNNGSIGQAFNAATAIVDGQITRTNADGTTDTFGAGSAQKSAASVGAATTGSAGSLACSVAAVNGAVGYAWFVGVAGSEKLAAVTPINSASITVVPDAGAQLASTLTGVDSSTSTLDFDGLLTQAFKSGSGAYIAVQPAGVAGTGTGLTSDGAGGVTEFEALFAAQWNKNRLSPTHIYMSATELGNLTKKIVANGGAPLLRITADAGNGAGTIQGGVKVGSYLNKVTGDVIPVIVHPNIPAGTILFYTATLPYALQDISDTCRMLMRQDYYQLEWPLKTRKYEFGVYADGVLQHYAPFSLGIITNIGNA
jgi:hypothetical protein